VGPTCKNERGRGNESVGSGRWTEQPFLFLDFFYSFFYFSSFCIYRPSRHLYIYIYLFILDQAQNNLNKIKCDNIQNFASA
jgi:hypothetical protein